MRTTKVVVGSATFSPWIVLDNTKPAFGVGIGVTLTPSASLTYSVQHSHDDPFNKQTPIAITRVTTTVTVNLTDHGMSANDWVHVEGANIGSADVFEGDFNIAAITDANNFTYTVVSAGATLAKSDAKVVLLRAIPNSVLVTQTASGDTNYAYPVRATRLIISAYTSGKATMTVNQGG